MKSHAKRCDVFLADPNLKEALSRRSIKLNIKHESEEEFKMEIKSEGADDSSNDELEKFGNGKKTVFLIDNQSQDKSVIIDGNCEKIVTENVIGIEAF